MTGKQDKQIQMIILDIDSVIPQDHLLRQIKDCVNFDFVYEITALYYSNDGRKFNEIVLQCREGNLVNGDMLVADGSFLPANISA